LTKPALAGNTLELACLIGLRASEVIT